MTDPEYTRRPGETASSYLARLSGFWAGAAADVLLAGDKTRFALFITRAAELVQAARAFREMEDAALADLLPGARRTK